MRYSNRLLYFVAFIISTTLIVFALYLQHYQDLEPCPLCILQRIAYIVIGILALIGSLSRRASYSSWLFYVFLITTLAGITTAVRHVWIEYFPSQALSCGGHGLGYMIQKLPLSELLPAIFRGTGDCGEVLWRFLGLSIAEWSLFWLFMFLLLALLIKKQSRHRNTFG